MLVSLVLAYQLKVTFGAVERLKVCRWSLPEVLLCQLPKYALWYDFLFSLKERCVYLGSSPSASNSGIGPTILSSVGLTNVTMLIRGCEPTKARCSMLLYLPLVATWNTSMIGKSRQLVTNEPVEFEK